MLKLGIFLLVLIVISLVAWPWASLKFVIWDASNPGDDGSSLNQILLLLTPIATIQELKERVGLQTSAILDVRSETEYDEGHIPGAILIEEQKLYQEVEERIPKKDTLIYIYDDNGEHGAVATRLLRMMGYDKAFSLQGGLNHWEKQGNPVDSLYNFPK